ncbi:MAG: phenylacetate--CoA ligase family protein [Pirellulales bacterium]
MTRLTYEDRRRLEALPGTELQALQLSRLNAMLAAILPHNRNYAEKLSDVKPPLTSLSQLAELPFTYKEWLLSSLLAKEMAVNLTWPIERYVRFHQTSGTRGRPLVVIDTAEDWQWWLDGWQFVLDGAQLQAGDRVLMAFSFGPFIGFWTAFEAAVQRGCLALPGGGLSSLARLDLMRTQGVKALFCTPSYALHLAEVAAGHKLNVASLGVEWLILAGEPGGSIPATRKLLEQTWQAQIVDHAGATEIGPWGYGDREGRGLHVLETEFIAEFLSVATGEPAGEGELSELVLTNLGRWGNPVIRYRTGDLVRPIWRRPGHNRFVLLEGGVLGRADDMVVIRGVNVFPSAIEQIIRGFPEVIEYRVTAFQVAGMDQLRVEIEDRLSQPQRVASELQLRLGLKLEVEGVPLGTLPRSDGKGQRFLDHRKEAV